MRFDILSLLHKAAGHFYNQDVINALKNLKYRNKTPPVICFDFLTLHIIVPHGKFIGILNAHIDFRFKGRKGEVIVDNNYRTQLSKRETTGSISFTKTFLKIAVKYLLQHCNFKWVV